MQRWLAATGVFLALLMGLQSSGLFTFSRTAYQAIFVGVAFSVLFLRSAAARPGESRGTTLLRQWITACPIAVLLVGAVYMAVNADRLTNVTSRLTTVDFWIGILLTLAFLEVIRRTTGYSFLIILAVGLSYLALGPYIPGKWGTPGTSLPVLMRQLYIGSSGVWGTVTSIVTLLVAMYVIFGQIMIETGSLAMLFKFGMWVGRRFRGGAAKSALLISGLFGTLNGSSAANAAVGGTFTIPLMLRSKYPRALAGAVEAVASTGGQIMPPVMGAGAFLIPEMLGIPYTTVILAAAIPAILYYWTAYFFVDALSGKMGIGAVSEAGEGEQKQMDELVAVGVMARQHGRSDSTIRALIKVVIPVGVLVYFLATGRSPQFAAFWATVAALAAMALLDWRSVAQVKESLTRLRDVVSGVVPMLTDLAALGVASQMLVVLIGLAGLGPKVAGLVLDISQKSLLLALLLTAVAITVLGMGVATTADFVIASAVFGPVLVQLGAPPLAMYLFVFFFACSSSLTPPVAAAAYVAAGLAGEHYFKVAIRACVLALSIFVVPFLFIYQPALLLQDLSAAGILVIIRVFIGMAAISIGLAGWFYTTARPLERLAIVAGSIGLLLPHVLFGVVGAVVTGFGLVLVWLRSRKEQMALASAKIAAVVATEHVGGG